MFFMNIKSMKADRGSTGGSEQLIIFGDERGRRGAELKVLHEIERLKPGKIARDFREKSSRKDGFDTDYMEIESEFMNYLVGKRGATQQKVEKAAGCVLLYVGSFACIAGDYKERQRCREYLGWLLKQLKGPFTVTNVKSRDDCTEVYVPNHCKGTVMGSKGVELRRVEQETNVFSFMALDENDEERLLIFSKEAGSKTSPLGRAAAERQIQEIVEKKERGDYNRGRSDSRPRKRRADSRDDSRKRQRYSSPPRNAKRNDSRRRNDSRKRNDSRGRGGGGGKNSRRNDSRGRGGGRNDSRGRGNNRR